MDDTNKKTSPTTAGATLTPRFVLVDDDPLFAKLIQKVAQDQHLPLTVFLSAEEAYRQLPLMSFDVALLDYDLGRVTGIQLCNYLEKECRSVPVLLVSHYGEIEQWRWPHAVRRSLNKKAGPYTILALAKKAYEDRLRKEG